MSYDVTKQNKKYNGSSSDGLRLAIFQIVKEKEGQILDLYYDAYCRYISKNDVQKRDIEQIKALCLPVKQRFSIILNRFLFTLTGGDEEYDLKESERDEEYALRFVVPARDRYHNVVLTTQSFYNIVASAVLNGLSGSRYSNFGEDIAHILNGLIYITFEDLWVSSVVGFRSQHSVIQKLLSKHIMIQEEERKSIWQEIHDDFLQGVAVILLKIEIIENFLDKDLIAVQKELNLIKTITKRIIKQTREIGHGFNSFWIQAKGFLFSLESFIKLFKEELAIAVELSTSPGVEKISGFAGITLFRIIQECLYNIGKHSRATYANISINIQENEIVVIIEDNGQGFNVREVRRKNYELKNLGLVFIRERVKYLNGSVQINSVKNIGTKVTVIIPLNSLLIKDDNKELNMGSINQYKNSDEYLGLLDT